MKVQEETAFAPKIRKQRTDKGKARLGYKTRLSRHVEVQDESKPKRSYVFKNRTKQTLDRYEREILKIVTENQQAIQHMGNGSLPFVIGMLVSKSIELIDEQGKMRNRLIKSTLLHLEKLKLIKVEFGKEFPYGAGTLQMV